MLENESSDSCVVIHQCLFGYDDGHRLLASSVKLSSESHSLLLLFTDLAPGINLNENGYYWTGIPLRNEKCYALIRTWGAPEMPRPGCVWSHVVLVKFSDIARFVNLGTLRSFTIRPDNTRGYDSYNEPIRVDVTKLLSDISSYTNDKINISKALRLIRALYESGKRTSEEIETKFFEFDDILFALWSQQHPRLRRSFNFTTASSKHVGNFSNVKFDIRFIISPNYEFFGNQEILKEASPWEKVILDDLLSVEPTEFRRFLWRYGSDVSNGRARFRLFAELYLKIRTSKIMESDFGDILELISKKIPVIADGMTLKEDFTSFEQNKYSLLPPGNAMEKISFFLKKSQINGILLPSYEKTLLTVEAILRSNATAINDLIFLAEIASNNLSEFGIVFLKCIAAVLTPNKFFPLTKNKKNLRKNLVLIKPELLDSDVIASLPALELLELVGFIPNRNEILNRLFPYFLQKNDEDLSDKLWQRFPFETLSTVIETLKYSQLQPAWKHGLRKNLPLLFAEGIIEKAQSTRFLATLANVLGYDDSNVLRMGITPWVDGILTVKDDIFGNERQYFLAFLLVLAIENPVPGAEIIFKFAFESVHHDIGNSCFHKEALSMLKRHLPDIGLIRNWDNCKRLRVALVSSYIHGNIEPMSFHSITKDKNLLEVLLDTASKTKKGRKFLQQISE